MKYRKLGNTGLIVSEVAAHVHFAAELHGTESYLAYDKPGIS